MSLLAYIEKNKNRKEVVTAKAPSFSFIYLQNFINKELFDKYLLKELLKEFVPENYPGLMILIKNKNEKEYDYLLASGNVLIASGDNEWFCAVNEIISRGVSESLLDPANLNGSRESLVESLPDNRALIKRRIKSSNLIFDSFLFLGATLTEVNLCYLKNLVDVSLLDEIKSKLNESIDQNITSVNDFHQIFQSDHLVPSLYLTSSIETIANSILHGKICIILDTSPVAIIVPNSLFEFTEIQNEVNNYSFVTIINRFLVFLFLFISVFGLGLFVCLTSYHIEFLQPIFIANFQLTEQGTTYSLFIELILVLLLFEFFRHMISRSPVSFVQNITLVIGGLFIGQNAVDASFIGAVSLIASSLAFVTGFAVTNNQEMITSLSIFRFFILCLSYTLGLVGFITSSLIVLLYLGSLKPFHKSMLYPFVPFRFTKIKEWIIPKKR